MTSTAYLASIPSPDRGVWFLGPVPLRAYALFIILGIIVAIWWGEKRLVARGGEPGMVIDIAVFAVPFGLIGGRLYHVITDAPKYFGPEGDPMGALKVWNGGLGIWGAIALGGVGALWGCRQRGIPLSVFADAVAPGIVVAQAIGRLGNYFNQELYGDPTTLPWGLEIYKRVNEDNGLIDPLNGVALDHTPITVVHPTFLYELLWNLGVAALLIWAERRFRLGGGRVFALYVAGYTAGRFWIELMRSDPATEFFGIRVNVYVSVLVFAGAVAYLIVNKNKGPEQLGGSRPESEEPVPVGVAAAVAAASATPVLDKITSASAAADKPAAEPEAEPQAAAEEAKVAEAPEAEQPVADEQPVAEEVAQPAEAAKEAEEAGEQLPTPAEVVDEAAKPESDSK
ncbi:prolipoprotein diacylglyceryl transferase [Pseudonocardiaceae bacterium YIM PH 21723]|nr:prolipoprotein diacylglyceryl transferase [Pseudonocardiaceae bacterium YIM PH 21723]